MKRKFVYIGVIVFFLTFIISDYFFKSSYSIPAPELYVKFDAKGGILFDSKGNLFYDEGMYLSFSDGYVEQSEIPDALKDGFFLEGWYADSKLTKKVFVDGEKTPLSQFNLNSGDYGGYSTTVYAKWECLLEVGGSRTLYFESNGGSKIKEISECTVCTPSFEEKQLPVPTRDGYEFDGWYSDKELTKRAYSIDDANYEAEYYDEEKTCPTTHSSGTLYAKWNKIETDICSIITGNSSLVISYNTNGGSSVGNTNICLTCGSTSVTLPAPTKKGYRFVGWYTDEKLTKRVTITDNSSKDISKLKITYKKDSNGCLTGSGTTMLYAKWEKESCPIVTGSSLTLSFDTSGLADIADINICTTCSEEKIELPIPLKKGYLFAGWYSDKNYIDFINIDSNVSPDINKLDVVNEIDSNGCKTTSSKATLYARWIYYLEGKNLVINYIDNNESEDPIYSSQDNKELYIPFKEGYEFDGWYTDVEFTKRIYSYGEIDNAVFELNDDDVISTKLYVKWKEKEVSDVLDKKSALSLGLIVKILVAILLVGVIVFFVTNKKILLIKKR